MDLSWDDAAKPEPLVLHYKQHRYEIPEMPAQLALWMRLAQADPDTRTPLSDMTDRQQAAAILGDTYEAMIADGAPDRFLARAVETALIDWDRGREVAIAWWKAGADPKAIAENLAAQVKAAADSAASPATDSGNQSTPPTGRSTRPTTSRRKTAPRKG